MEVKIYDQEWKHGKNLSDQKIHTVVGEDQIANLMLSAEILRPNVKDYQQNLLLLYQRNQEGMIDYQFNLKQFKL